MDAGKIPPFFDLCGKKPYEAKIQSLVMIVSLMNLILCVNMFSF